MNDSGSDFRAAAREMTGAWPLFVAMWEEFRLRYGLRLRAEIGDTDQIGFITEALGSAYGKGGLDHLVELLEQKELVTPAFGSAIGPYCGKRYTMQSVVDGVWRTQYVGRGLKWLIRARENVCRISVDGTHRGTGVLIKPNLIATAAHVVEPLVDASGHALPGSLARLAIQFCPDDDEEDEGEDEGTNERTPPLIARLHRNWLGYYSAPAPQENRGLSITSIAGIAEQGPWDLAVIQLHTPPAPGMKGYSRVASFADPPSFGVHVIHHPATDVGEPSRMLWSVGQVRQALGNPMPLRWLHDASTSGGSSGAPCFNNDWKLVALHQAGPHTMREPGQNNRAVPIHAWAPYIDGWANTTTAIPYLAFVPDENGQQIPVIGRRDLQTAVWRAMMSTGTSSDRTFFVRGDTGLGKSFTIRIVRALARLVGGRVIPIDVGNAQADDAPAFARRVIGAFAAELSADQLAPSGVTTELRDVTNDVGPKLISTLAELTEGRHVWLVLHGWDESAFPPSHPVRILVDLLLAGLDRAKGLHLVLTGWTGSIPGAYLETLSPPTAQDIADHVLAALVPGGDEPPEMLNRFIVNTVASRLQDEPPGEPYMRAIAVAEKTRLEVGGKR